MKSKLQRTDTTIYALGDDGTNLFSANLQSTKLDNAELEQIAQSMIENGTTQSALVEGVGWIQSILSTRTEELNSEVIEILEAIMDNHKEAILDHSQLDDVEPPPAPRVLVTVTGGVAESICDPGVNVVILDYDVEGSDETFKDADGATCEQRWVAEGGDHKEILDKQFEHLKKEN